VELDVAGSSPVVEGAKGTVTLLRGGTAAAHDGKKEEHPTNKNKQVKETKGREKNPAGIVGEKEVGVNRAGLVVPRIGVDSWQGDSGNE